MPRSIYFHEDDYCQIEILPAENLPFCLEQAGIIETFSDEHRDGAGWTDMYVRREHPSTLADKGLSKDVLIAALAGVLPRYDAVTTGYSTYREPVEDAGAFGRSEELALFYNHKDGVVQNIWLSLCTYTPGDVADAAALLSALRPLGEFLLADWGWGFIRPLVQEDALTEYLEKRLAVFGGEATT